MKVCIHEDRPQAYLGVKLLVASLLHHCPRLAVEVSTTDLHEDYRQWLESRGVVARARPELAGKGWNVKPTLLLEQLDSGESDVVWMDSDMIVSGDLLALLGEQPTSSASPDSIVVTEDHAWAAFVGTGVRASLWGLTLKRPLPYAVNSGLVRVNPSHRELIIAWARLLGTRQYRKAQELPFLNRPLHMVGDQDVLEALLCSERFASIPVRCLRRGVGVVTHTTAAGYRVSERMASLWRGLPVLLHSIEPKPWGVRSSFDRLVLETSPYLHEAVKYASELDHKESRVVVERSLFSRFLSTLFADHPSLKGLPLAALGTLKWWVKRGLLRRHDWPTPESFLEESLRIDGDQTLTPEQSAGGLQ